MLKEHPRGHGGLRERLAPAGVRQFVLLPWSPELDVRVQCTAHAE